LNIYTKSHEVVCVAQSCTSCTGPLLSVIGFFALHIIFHSFLLFLVAKQGTMCGDVWEMPKTLQQGGGRGKKSLAHCHSLFSELYWTFGDVLEC
jgi:hypothetical protein